MAPSPPASSSSSSSSDAPVSATGCLMLPDVRKLSLSSSGSSRSFKRGLGSAPVRPVSQQQ